MTEQPWIADPAHYFDVYGYAPLPKLVDADLVGFLDRCARIDVGSGDPPVDERQVRGSRVRYGAPVFDALVADLLTSISERLRLRLLPTYSFFRSYGLGMGLDPHTDRSACEVSVSLHLGSDDGARWPVWIADPFDTHVAINLKPGDAVAYRGCERPHWREPSPSSAYRQVFLHYVDADGPHAHLVNDGRAALGLPSPTGAP